MIFQSLSLQRPGFDLRKRILVVAGGSSIHNQNEKVIASFSALFAHSGQDLG